MSNSSTGTPVSCAARTITTQTASFNRLPEGNLFTVNEDNKATDALAEANCLLAGVKDVLQSEANENGSITNSHYILLAVIDTAKALIASVECGIRRAS